VSLQGKFNKYNYFADANNFITTKFQQRANANCSETFIFEMNINEISTVIQVILKNNAFFEFQPGKNFLYNIYK